MSAPTATPVCPQCCVSMRNRGALYVQTMFKVNKNRKTSLILRSLAPVPHPKATHHQHSWQSSDGTGVREKSWDSNIIATSLLGHGLTASGLRMNE